MGADGGIVCGVHFRIHTTQLTSGTRIKKINTTERSVRAERERVHCSITLSCATVRSAVQPTVARVHDAGPRPMQSRHSAMRRLCEPYLNPTSCRKRRGRLLNLAQDARPRPHGQVTHNAHENASTSECSDDAQSTQTIPRWRRCRQTNMSTQ